MATHIHGAAWDWDAVEIEDRFDAGFDQDQPEADVRSTIDWLRKQDQELAAAMDAIAKKERDLALAKAADARRGRAASGGVAVSPPAHQQPLRASGEAVVAPNASAERAAAFAAAMRSLEDRASDVERVCGALRAASEAASAGTDEDEAAADRAGLESQVSAARAAFSTAKATAMRARRALPAAAPHGANGNVATEALFSALEGRIRAALCGVV